MRRAAEAKRACSVVPRCRAKGKYRGKWQPSGAEDTHEHEHEHEHETWRDLGGGASRASEGEGEGEWAVSSASVCVGEWHAHGRTEAASWARRSDRGGVGAFRLTACAISFSVGQSSMPFVFSRREELQQTGRFCDAWGSGRRGEWSWLGAYRWLHRRDGGAARELRPWRGPRARALFQCCFCGPAQWTTPVLKRLGPDPDASSDPIVPPRRLSACFRCPDA